MNTISGTEAIERMRAIKNTNEYFMLQHLTYDCNTKHTDGLRTVSQATLRSALPNETFATDSDHYLTYTDLSINQPRMCFKKLIRKVAFAPNYNWLNVNWFV